MASIRIIDSEEFDIIKSLKIKLSKIIYDFGDLIFNKED